MSGAVLAPGVQTSLRISRGVLGSRVVVSLRLGASP